MDIGVPLVVYSIVPNKQPMSMKNCRGILTHPPAFPADVSRGGQHLTSDFLVVEPSKIMFCKKKQYPKGRYNLALHWVPWYSRTSVNPAISFGTGGPSVWRVQVHTGKVWQ